MRRPFWLWIVIALYALVGLTNLRTAFHTALGAETGFGAEVRAMLALAALVSGAAACLAAYWALRGEARAIPASLAFLGLFMALALWGTAIAGAPTSWGFLLFWVGLFSAMSFFLRVAKQRGHLA
jgi:hypothetical protein